MYLVREWMVSRNLVLETRHPDGKVEWAFGTSMIWVYWETLYSKSKFANDFSDFQLSKRTDQQKSSVSNANFIKFQRSFFLVYFLALLGDWLQGPYVYRVWLFNIA